MVDGTGMLDSIKESITQMTGLGETFIDDVDSRLKSFGYQIQDSDIWMILFCIQKVVNTIKNECNVSKIPNELIQVAVDMVCGEFLFAKKGSGQLQGFEINLDAAVKQIQEGDTNVVFTSGEGSMTPEQRLNSLIAFLLGDGKRQFISFRRLKW